jgi:hypothetical protein
VDGGGPVARGEAPGPAHEDRKWVRWLSIDGVAETKARCSGGGLLEAEKRRWDRTDSSA